MRTKTVDRLLREYKQSPWHFKLRHWLRVRWYIIWRRLTRPFSIVNDFMFTNDCHHIVSKRGWEKLDNNE